MKGSTWTSGFAGTVAFAAALGGVSALLLTGAGAVTAPYRKANARADEVRSILDCLGVPCGPEPGPAGLLETFSRNVEATVRNGLRLYRYRREGGAVEAVAVPFGGPGLWGPVEGFLALEPDMTTVRAITFHRQEETPGLGGEIAAASFRSRFEGKRIVDDSGSAGIRIVRPGASPTRAGAARASEVDGITGATMTCERVQAMLNGAIAKVVDASAVETRDADAR